MNKRTIIEHLTRYFDSRADVRLAFLFGSQAKGRMRAGSDWDIAVYLKPKQPIPYELEANTTYPQESDIWRDVERIVGTDVDLVVLNRAPAPFVYSMLHDGTILTMKDRRLYLRLLLKTHYEAVDFWQLTEDFWAIRERSRSFTKEDRAALLRHLAFLETELEDTARFRSVDQQTYMRDRDTKRNIERWVENLVMAAIDIAKIVLAAEKKQIPNSYRDILHSIGIHYFDEQFADAFSTCAELRNIVAHEYLDLRWHRINAFLAQVDTLYPRFLTRMKKVANKPAPEIAETTAADTPRDATAA